MPTELFFNLRYILNYLFCSFAIKILNDRTLTNWHVYIDQKSFI